MLPLWNYVVVSQQHIRLLTFFINLYFFFFFFFLPSFVIINMTRVQLKESFLIYCYYHKSMFDIYQIWSRFYTKILRSKLVQSLVEWHQWCHRARKTEYRNYHFSRYLHKIAPKSVYLFVWLFLHSTIRLFCSLFKVRYHEIGCINHDIVVCLCSELFVFLWGYPTTFM